MSLVDQMLGGGCAVAVDSVHGEFITVLSGKDAGKKFRIMQRETQSDVAFDGDLVPDPRSRRTIRFRNGTPVPNIAAADKIQTEDGKIWNAIKSQQDGYLSTDYELSEVISKDT